MTEIELIEAGFKKVDISAEENGSDAPYYYYEYNIIKSSGEDTYFSLVTPANDEVKNPNEWNVHIFDYAMKLSDINDIKDLLRILQKAAG